MKKKEYKNNHILATANYLTDVVINMVFNEIRLNNKVDFDISLYHIDKVLDILFRIETLVQNCKSQEDYDIPISPTIEYKEVWDKLTTRAQNVMRCLDIKSVDQLVKLTYEDFIELPNIGRKTINEIKDILAEYGLKLAKSH